MEQVVGKMSGLVALVGRPNVGKSTLFNRLTRSKSSIVHDQPGVTRDRLYGQVYYDKKSIDGFTLVDTGGFETKEFNFQPFHDNLVWQQTEKAIQDSDLVVMMFDAKSGLHQHDRDLVHFLERIKKPVIFVANKVDGEEKADLVWEFYATGIEACLGVSAAHNKGIKELLAHIKQSLSGLKSSKKQALFSESTKIALIGKPNAGKSSILNRLVGEERSLVSDIAGTTRDSIDTPFAYNNKKYLLIDTAGIRRKTKIKEQLESQSVIRSISAIERADVVCLVVDAIEGLTDQDARLVNLAIDRHKPILVIVNKWDLVPQKSANTARDYADNIRKLFLRELDYLPIHFMSCLENKRVHQVFKRIEELEEQGARKVKTSRVNEVLQQAVDRHTPQLVRKFSKRVKFYFATQVASNPPTFVVMCNLSDEIQESYKRYLARQFKKELGFVDVPIRLIWRGKKEQQERKNQETSEKLRLEAEQYELKHPDLQG